MRVVKKVMRFHLLGEYRHRTRTVEMAGDLDARKFLRYRIRGSNPKLIRYGRWDAQVMGVRGPR